MRLASGTLLGLLQRMERRTVRLLVTSRTLKQVCTAATAATAASLIHLVRLDNLGDS